MKKIELTKVWYRLDNKGNWTVGKQKSATNCERCNAILMTGQNGSRFCNRVALIHKINEDQLTDIAAERDRLNSSLNATDETPELS